MNLFKKSSKIVVFVLMSLLSFTTTASPAATVHPRAEEFLSWKYGLFLHFGMGTFVGREWASGHEDPSLFSPSDFDCDQWADVAVEAGMRYAVLITKHTSGFALWDSGGTDHDITAFKNFRDGKGDIVAEFVKAFRKRDIKIGLYYCLPGNYSGKLAEGQTDLHGLAPEAGTGTNRVAWIKKQLTELLTQYGPVDVLWMDQYANRYTGKDWSGILAHVRTLQPNCLVVANNSLSLNQTDITSYEYPYLKRANPKRAFPPEDNTLPAEVCDVLSSTWFWNSSNTSNTLLSAEEIVARLQRANARKANYLLNVAPDKTGRIPAIFAERLKEARQILDKDTVQK